MPTYPEVVKSIGGQSADDLFICSSGVEETCLDVSVNASENSGFSIDASPENRGYLADNAVIIRYKEPAKNYSKWFASYEKRCADALKCIWDEQLGQDVKEIEFLRGAPGPNVRAFEDFMEKDLEGVINSITIDATSILDEDLFGLLYVLDKPQNSLRVLYSEPPKGTLPLSRGTDGQGTVPFFDGNYHSHNTVQHVCAYLCGYDAGKLYALNDRIRASHNFLFFPKPSFHRNWDALSKRVNKLEVRSIRPNSLMDVSGLDPLAVKSALEGIYKKYPFEEEDYDKRWYMQVALAGCTKWQVVGAYLFARDTLREVESLRGDKVEHSPVGVYYCTGVLHTPIYGDGRIGEFLVPKKT